MIFVTVGTHEQQFDRLIRKMDELKGDGILQEDVVIQTGYCRYEPVNCIWKQWFDYEEMTEQVKNARIVVTHGGPSSFFLPMQYGRVPVVVPRQKKYGEHVNDHQLRFLAALKSLNAGIIVAEEMDELQKVLAEYGRENKERITTAAGWSNNLDFNRKFEALTVELLA